MRHQTAIVAMGVILAVVCALVPAADARQNRPDPERWEDVIAAWEAEDRETPPPDGAIVFVGSSSIRFWIPSTKTWIR